MISSKEQFIVSQAVQDVQEQLQGYLMTVLPAPLLWLGWPCAAPPPRLLRALRPIPFGVGVICDIYFLVLLLQPLQLAALHLEICPY